MMQVFVLKFKTVSKLQLPVLMARHKSPTSSGSGTTVGGGQTPTQDSDVIKSEDVKPSMSTVVATAGVLSPYSDFRDGEEKKLKFGFPPSQAANYSVADCRALVIIFVKPF